MTRKKRRPQWTSFEPAYMPPEIMKLAQADQVWLNNRYQVIARSFLLGDGVTMTHLSIKRRDKASIKDWRDLQRIKNEILGTDVEAVELYPNEDRLVDTANQYHLWALPAGYTFPFGFGERLVTEITDGPVGESQQRPFDEKPGDLADKNKLNRIHRELGVIT